MSERTTLAKGPPPSGSQALVPQGKRRRPQALPNDQVSSTESDTDDEEESDSDEEIIKNFREVKENVCMPAHWMPRDRRGGGEVEHRVPDEWFRSPYAGGLNKPKWEEFKPFSTFVTRIEPFGRHYGIVKVIPPEEWYEELGPNYANQKVALYEIKEPLRQTWLEQQQDEGNPAAKVAGIFEIFRGPLKHRQGPSMRFSVKDWWKRAQENKPPSLDLIDKIMRVHPTDRRPKTTPDNNPVSVQDYKAAWCYDPIHSSLGSSERAS